MLLFFILIILFLYFRKSYYKKTKNKSFWFKLSYILTIFIPLFILLFFIYLNFNPFYEVINVGFIGDTSGVVFLEENENLNDREKTLFSSYRMLDGLVYAVYNSSFDNLKVSIKGDDVYLIKKPKMIDYIKLDYENLDAFDNFNNSRDLIMLIDDCLYFDKTIYFRYFADSFSLSFEFLIEDFNDLQTLISNDDFEVILDNGFIYLDDFSYNVTKSYNELMIIYDEDVELFINDEFVGISSLNNKSEEIFIGKDFIGSVCNIKFTDEILNSKVLKAEYNTSKIPIIGFNGKFEKLKIKK